MHRCFVRLATPSILLTALLAACATARAQRPAPAEVLTHPPLTYEAGFHAEELGVSPPDSLATEWTRAAEVDVLVLRLDVEEARALEGEGRLGPRAWTTCWDELAPYLALFGTADPRLVSAPQLLAAEGRTSTFALLDQHAYVSEFELRGDQDSLIADPIVKTFTTGLTLEARAALAPDESHELELTIRHCELDGPLATREARLPGVPTPVAVQTPILCTQRLSTRATLGRDECLVLSWNDYKSLDRRMFALVGTRPAGPTGTN